MPKINKSVASIHFIYSPDYTGKNDQVFKEL